MGDLCLSQTPIWLKQCYHYISTCHVICFSRYQTHCGALSWRTAYSFQQRDLHVDHLRSIFLRFHHFNIRLNPHKCVFYVKTGRLLGFIMSKDGIRIDPLNIESILAPPAPTNVTELQSLQGKEKNLRRFHLQLCRKDTWFHVIVKKWYSFCMGWPSVACI